MPAPSGAAADRLSRTGVGIGFGCPSACSRDDPAPARTVVAASAPHPGDQVVSGSAMASVVAGARRGFERVDGIAYLEHQVDEPLLALHLLRPGGPAAARRSRFRIVPGARREHVDAIAQVDGFLDRVRDEEDRRLRFAPQRRPAVSCMRSRVAGSSAPNGSSIRMIRGDRISVRAIATRWRMPPDSWMRILRRVAHRRRARPCRSTRARARAARRAGTPRHSRPNATLSSTVRLSNDV